MKAIKRCASLLVGTKTNIMIIKKSIKMDKFLIIFGIMALGILLAFLVAHLKLRKERKKR